jgi:aminocarboxymuconate-semialdehyde decarboxylase
VPIIDFHSHFYPPEYLEELEQGRSAVTVRRNAGGQLEVHYPGDYNVIAPGHRDIDFRVRELDANGIDAQVISLTTPGVHVEEPGRSAELAALVNDALARACRQYPGRFHALAALPLNDPAAAERELERAVTRLGHRGALVFSNVNGVLPGDRRFWPVYARAESLGVPLFIHPTSPAHPEAMREFWLVALVGFGFDTTLAVAHLLFNGVFERFPGLKVVLSHLGGAIPYFAERLDRGHRAFADCRRFTTRRPSDQLKALYYDTVLFDPGPLQLARRFCGSDHMLLGSDYPHMIGDLPGAVRTIHELPIAEEEKGRILGGNALAVLGLTGRPGTAPEPHA